MKKTLLITTILGIIFLFATQTVHAQYLDLSCQKHKFLDPTYTGDCQINEDLEFVFVRDLDCQNNPPVRRSCEDVARASGNSPRDYRCLRQTETLPGAVNRDYTCERVYDITGTLCGDPNCVPDQNKRCTNVNIFSVKGNRSTPVTDTTTWACLDYDSLFHINIFGVDLGPADVALAKIIRTVMTVFFVVFGVMSLWQFIYALWLSTTDREVESFETTQKTVKNTLIGLFFALIGIVVVQLFANLFGISGNIFDFTYIGDL